MAPKQNRAGWRRRIFLLILAAPLLIMLTLVGAIVVRLVQVWRLEPDQLQEEVKQLLAYKQGEPFKLSVQDGQEGFRYPWCDFQTLKGKPGQRVIYAFGGSSLVYPRWTNFPAFLRKGEEKEPRQWHVVNFGHAGYDSFSVRQQVEKAVRRAPPDLVIIYSGHNDFTSAYWNDLLPHLYLVAGSPVLNALSGLAYYIGSSMRDASRDVERLTYEVYMHTSLEPAMFGMMSRTVGLYSGFHDMFSKINKLVLQGYQRNLNAMLGVCRKAGVPVLLVTPVSNLHFAPVGLDGEAEQLFARGLAAASYKERIKLLARARDADVFSGMVRAKSMLLNHLRSRHKPPSVYVLDLEDELHREQNPMDDTQFSDALHMTVPMHKTVARYLFWYIVDKFKFGGAAAASPP